MLTLAALQFSLLALTNGNMSNSTLHKSERIICFSVRFPVVGGVPATLGVMVVRLVSQLPTSEEIRQQLP
jgi:hypothetical protein